MCKPPHGGGLNNSMGALLCQALELPEEDCLYGLRVHSWVLVLAGKRDVDQSFFIEPLTGLPHPLDSSNYLGIESVWNHRNYWVNMQDCSEGVTVGRLPSDCRKICRHSGNVTYGYPPSCRLPGPLREKMGKCSFFCILYF